MRIELAGRLPLLRRETPLHHADHTDVLIVDTQGLVFASPLDLAAMVALAHSAAARGTATTIVTPRDYSVASYLERMDVFARLPPGTRVEGPLPAQARNDRSNALIEVVPTSVDTEQDLVNRVGRVAFAHLFPEVRNLAFQAMGELIDNAVSHGAGAVGAFVAAQTYTGASTGRRGMEFAICDTGIGILEHLRGNPDHRDLDDELEALDLALRRGITGTREDRGNGLADLLNVAEAGGYARLVLRSGHGLASIVVRQHDRRRRYVMAADQISGTWAWLRVRYP